MENTTTTIGALTLNEPRRKQNAILLAIFIILRVCQMAFPEAVKKEIEFPDYVWIGAAVSYVICALGPLLAPISSIARKEALRLYILRLIPSLACLTACFILARYCEFSQKPTRFGILAFCQCACLGCMS